MPEGDAARRPLAGIFVGGKGTRMGGRAKGLLLAPDGRTLVERLRATVDPLADVVLVGDADAYAALELETLADDPAGIGPLGGLTALLRRGQRGRPGEEGGTVLAIACDMPFVSRELLEGLLFARARAPIVAPRRADRWEPLCARYDSARVLPVAEEHVRRGELSLQRLLDRLGAAPLPEDAYDPRELRDWDAPEDVGYS
jgi:molybdopterin-guanine dinucleotide biosynthesis protein A